MSKILTLHKHRPETALKNLNRLTGRVGCSPLIDLNGMMGFHSIAIVSNQIVGRGDDSSS